jgi:hypothetical protein
MKTRTTIHWLAGVAGGLLLALPGLAWADVPWGAGGIVGALEACEDELAECQEQPGMTFPGDGQTGAPLAYAEADPPDGTFIDLNTGLMWEIKTDDGSIHDVDGTYSWYAAFDFVDALNADEFAYHDDWRLPTAKELQSLVDYSRPNPEEPDVPAVSDELPGATAPAYYWSSTANANLDGNAWYVNFNFGNVYDNIKVNDFHVRAVRGGW